MTRRPIVGAEELCCRRRPRGNRLRSRVPGRVGRSALDRSGRPALSVDSAAPPAHRIAGGRLHDRVEAATAGPRTDPVEGRDLHDDDAGPKRCDPVGCEPVCGHRAGPEGIDPDVGVAAAASTSVARRRSVRRSTNDVPLPEPGRHHPDRHRRAGALPRRRRTSAPKPASSLTGNRSGQHAGTVEHVGCRPTVSACLRGRPRRSARPRAGRAGRRGECVRMGIPLVERADRRADHAALDELGLEFDRVCDERSPLPPPYARPRWRATRPRRRHGAGSCSGSGDDDRRPSGTRRTGRPRPGSVRRRPRRGSCRTQPPGRDRSPGPMCRRRSGHAIERRDGVHRRRSEQAVDVERGRDGIHRPSDRDVVGRSASPGIRLGDGV